MLCTFMYLLISMSPSHRRQVFSYAHGVSFYAPFLCCRFLFSANPTFFNLAPFPCYAPWARWEGGEAWAPLPLSILCVIYANLTFFYAAPALLLMLHGPDGRGRGAGLHCPFRRA